MIAFYFYILFYILFYVLWRKTMRFLSVLGLFCLSLTVNAAQLSEVKLNPSDQAKWLKFIYPAGKISKVDNQTVQSFWAIPANLKRDFKDAHSGKYALSQFYKAFLIDDSSEKRLVFLTNNAKGGDNFNSAKESQECHGCAGVLGMTIITLTPKPKVVAHRPVVTQIGGWGQLPTESQLIQVAPNRYALKFLGGFTQSGITVEGISLIDMQSLREILTETVSEDNSGNCTEDDKNCVYHYDSRFKVLTTQPPNAGYYPIEIESNGTIHDERLNKIVNYHVRKIFRYNGKQYTTK